MATVKRSDVVATSGTDSPSAPSNSEQTNAPTTLLSTQHQFVCSLSLSCYIILIGLQILNHRGHLSSRVCVSEPFPEWMTIFNAISVGASSGACLLHGARTFFGRFQSNGENTKSAFITMFTITIISSSSQIFQLGGLFEHTCEDYLGVKSPVIQWAEWQISVPMMFYLCVTLDADKAKLDFTDFLILFGSWGGIFFTFVTNWGLGSHTSIVFLTFSVMSMFVALAFNLDRSWKSLTASSFEVQQNLSPLSHIRHVIANRKFSCSVYLAAVFPVFPLIYFLGVSDVISKDLSILITLMLNYVAKLLYSILIMDSHLEVLDQNIYQLLAEKKANEARRAFLRYVFHEVRVPLNSISMGLHLLLESEDVTDEDKDTIGMMKEATMFMSETLNDVLSIQKIEEGKLELSYEHFYISDVAKTVQLSLKGQVASKNITLLTIINDDVPKRVNGDRFRIEHVLANLLSNAIKFSPENSSIRIVIAKESVKNIYAADKITVNFSVIDEGVGISPEDQKSLFLPYTQIRPGELQQGRGTGVGLAICREIILLHGGEVGCISKLRLPNQPGGSRFFFEVPFEVIPCESKDGQEDPTSADQDRSDKDEKCLAQPDQALVLEPANVAAVSSSDDKEFKLDDMSTWRFLLVDDVMSNRKMLNMLLSKKRIQCDMAINGLECLQKYGEFSGYKMIFMDNMMPEMNGNTASKKLRELGYDQILVGLTGNAMDEDVESFMAAGVDLVLTKPMKMDQLEKLLHFCQINGFTSPTEAGAKKRFAQAITA